MLKLCLTGSQCLNRVHHTAAGTFEDTMTSYLTHFKLSVEMPSDTPEANFMKNT